MQRLLISYFTRPELNVQEKHTDDLTQIFVQSLSTTYNTSFNCLWAAFDDDNFWDSIFEKLQNLLYNQVIFPDTAFRNQQEFLAFIDAHHPMFSPQEKLDAVLEYIHGQTSFDGEVIFLDLLAWWDREVPRRFYMTNGNELKFYIAVLKEDGYISYDDTDGSAMYVHITLKGLNKLLALAEKKNSRICFVAMSFSKELESVYTNAIAPAVNENGFVPLLLRDEQVDADKTINDAILAGLKKARFTLADFTGHRVNVYFGAGFALGRGQKVIYSCREDEVEKAGFDTRNFQHLVWKDEEDFRKKLSAKIQAYILD